MFCSGDAELINELCLSLLGMVEDKTAPESRSIEVCGVRKEGLDLSLQPV